jgi:hypothetical protein
MMLNAISSSNLDTFKWNFWGDKIISLNEYIFKGGIERNAEQGYTIKRTYVRYGEE